MKQNFHPGPIGDTYVDMLRSDYAELLHRFRMLEKAHNEVFTVLKEEGCTRRGAAAGVVQRFIWDLKEGRVNPPISPAHKIYLEDKAALSAGNGVRKIKTTKT